MNRTPIGLLLLIAFAGSLPFLAALFGGFQSDDFQLLLAVREGGPFGLWSGPGTGFLRPLVSLSLWLDHAVWGLRPFGYHLTNFLVHVGNAALVGVLVDRLRRRWALPAYAPGLAAGLFALLPAHAEAICWVSGRTDLLAAFWALIAAVLALGERRWQHAAAVLAFALALLTKESALMLPLALLLFSGGERSQRGPILALLALLPLYALLRWAWLGGVGGYGMEQLPEPARWGFHLALYPAKAILPASVQQLTLAAPALQVGFLVSAVAALALVGVAIFRRLSEAGRSIGAFLLLALPALPLGMSWFTTEGERYLYLPSVALVGLLVVGVAAVERRGWRVGGLAALLVGWAAGAGTAAVTWRIAGGLAEAAVARAEGLPPGPQLVATVPDSYRGAYILRNGLREALALRGREVEAAVASSFTLSRLGQRPEAVREGQRLRIEAPPTDRNALHVPPDQEAMLDRLGIRIVTRTQTTLELEAPEEVRIRVLLPEAAYELPAR
jgi:protein O-mannosyl-transferase